MIPRPTPEQVENVFCRDSLLEALKSKIKDGHGIAPEDMVSLCKIVFDTAVSKTCEYYEERMNGDQPRTH